MGRRDRTWWTQPPKWADQLVEELDQAHSGPVRYVPEISVRGAAGMVVLVLAAGGIYAAGQGTDGARRVMAAFGVFLVLAALTLVMGRGAVRHHNRSKAAKELAGSGVGNMWLAVGVSAILTVLAPVALMAA